MQLQMKTLMIMKKMQMAMQSSNNNDENNIMMMRIDIDIRNELQTDEMITDYLYLKR